jgi:ribonuclease P protein component
MQADRQQLQSLVLLKNRADFLKIQTQGQKWVSHGLILQILPNQLGQTRVGFTVSKKADASAVRRNRIKRRLRSVAADVLPLYAQGSCDYVLVGRTLSATRPYDSLVQDLKWCLEKLGRRQQQQG